MCTETGRSYLKNSTARGVSNRSPTDASAKTSMRLGARLSRAFKLQGEKVLIIGETTYEWYVSYMAMLCGVGIAVPTDKELPENELENIIKRSDAAAVIFSPKKKRSE